MIKGLSERRRLPRAGKIRLGVMVQSAGGKRSYPKAVDHFVCPEAVLTALGVQEPKDLPIMFPVDDPEQIFPQSLKMYKTAGLFCAGDGETAKRWDEHGDLKERACPCEYLERGECHPVATLNFILPDVPGIGVYQIDTSNKASIVSLNTALEKFRAIFGGLRGIPFLLRIEPHTTERFDEQKKQMVKTEGFALRLDSPYSFRQILEWRKSLGAEALALMPTPDSEPPTDAVALPAGQTPETADRIDQTSDEPRPALLASCLGAAALLGVAEAHAAVIFTDLSADRLADYLALLRDAKDNAIVRDTVLATLRAEYRKRQQGNLV